MQNLTETSVLKMILLSVLVLVVRLASTQSTPTPNPVDAPVLSLKRSPSGVYYFPLSVGSNTLNITFDSQTSYSQFAGLNCTDNQTIPCSTNAPALYNSKSGKFFPCSTTNCQCAAVKQLNNGNYCVFDDLFSENVHMNSAAISDDVVLLTTNITSFGFGYGYAGNDALLSLLKEQISGVIGLGISNTTAVVPSLLETAVKQKGLRNVFAACVGPSSGRLSFGSSDPLQYTGNVTYVSTTDASSYFLSLSAASIDNTPILLPPSDISIRFGKFDTVFSTMLYTKIRTVFQNYCDSLQYVCGAGNLFDGGCQQLSPTQVAKYPTITLSFDSVPHPVNISLPPTSYFINSDDGTCVKFAFKQAASLRAFNDNYDDNDDDVEGTVLGMSILRQFSVIYDNEKHMIGFAATNTTNCEAWTTGVSLSQQEWLMNLIILGSVFGFMGLSLLVIAGFQYLHRSVTAKTGYQSI